MIPLYTNRYEGIQKNGTVRLGAQEITRRGISLEQVDVIVDIIMNILVKKEEPIKYRDVIKEISTSLNKVYYSFDIECSP